MLQADNISEQRRASAFGILSGVTSAAYVCGTLAARLLSTTRTFQVFLFLATKQAFLLSLISPKSDSLGLASFLVDDHDMLLFMACNFRLLQWHP